MLLSVSIENWMSFRDRATFTMVASRERQHNERVPRIDRYKTKVLPVAVIYGGNASGKTNFFKALSFAKRFVVDGTQPDSLIPVDPYRLDSTGPARPSQFVFEILVDETIYEFSFSVNESIVAEERLILVTNTGERTLYHRKEESVNFDKSLEDKKFLDFAFKGTRENQLFLTNSVSQKVGEFRPVYDWFKQSLALVAPDSRFEPFERFLDEGHPLFNTMNEILPTLDTGIVGLGGEEIPLESIPFAAALKSEFQEKTMGGKALRFLGGPANERFLITRKDDKLAAKKLITYHCKHDGDREKFDIRQESDGSQRIIDLLPAFLDIASRNSKKVYVVDELDRSLHTLLTKKLLESYLESCSSITRSQLLFTTHDVLLMDQSLFRRDEMWVAERNSNGESSLISFSDYKDVRYDKDIRKSYLQGRLGGVPRILLNRVLLDPDSSNIQADSPDVQ